LLVVQQAAQYFTSILYPKLLRHFRGSSDQYQLPPANDRTPEGAWKQRYLSITATGHSEAEF
jgi:hypothetical protein